MQLLDSLASVFPIDFYVESFQSLNTKENKNIFSKFFYDVISGPEPKTGPIHKVLSTMYICHNKRYSRPSPFSVKCPTKNIKWQFADTRQRPNTKWFERFVFLFYLLFQEDHLGFSEKTILKELKSFKNKYLFLSIFKRIFDNSFIWNYPEKESLIYKQISKMNNIYLQVYLSHNNLI